MCFPHGEVTLEEVNNHGCLSLLCSDVPLDAEVDVNNSVIGINSSLVNKGHFVEFSDNDTSSMVSPKCKIIIYLDSPSSGG